VRDAAYVVAGYVITGAAVTGYAVSVRLRLRRALQRLQHDVPDGGVR
jgi:hypothetical protein